MLIPPKKSVQLYLPGCITKYTILAIQFMYNAN